MRIAAAGLPLRLKARLAGRMKEAEVKAVHSGQELLDLLKGDRFDLVIVDEEVASPDAIATLESLQPLYGGPIIFLARANHPAAFLTNLVRRLRVSAVLNHPIDPEELVRRASIEMSSRVPSPAHEEAVGSEPGMGAIPPALLPVWRKHEATNQTRAAILAEASSLDLTTLTDEERETARRAAHQLAGSLGTFGLHQATLLAREAEDLLRRGTEVTAAQQQRFRQVVGAIEVQLADPSARVSEPVAEAPEGILLIFSSDDEWVGNVTEAASAGGWRVIATSDGLGLRKIFALNMPKGVVLDLSDTSSQEGVALVDDLSGRGSAVALVAVVPHQGYALSDGVTTRLKASDAKEVVAALKDAPLAGRTQQKPAQILVVDDDPVVLETLVALLGGLNVEVHGQQDALQFWDTLSQVKPDLIILDVDLPYLGGVELCRAVRSDPAYGSVPVLFLSAYNDADTIHRVFQAGGDDYIFKPVVGPELITRVSNRIQRSRAFERAVFRSFGSDVEMMARIEQPDVDARPDLGLVVADEVLAGALADMARSLGRTVTWVRGSGDAVLAELTGPLERRPRVVILEDPDGLDFLRMLEGVGVPSACEVWLMGELNHDELLVCYDVGAAGYVPLGLSGNALRRWLDHILRPPAPVLATA